MEMNVSRTWFVMLRQISFDENLLKITHKVDLHQEMFRTANPRGLEIVIHFLLTKLDPGKSRERFKPCWPIQDKNEERQFRKLCVDWLNDLGDICPGLGFNSTRKPSVILLNPLGDKVYTFLFYFTYFVLVSQLQAFSNKYKHLIPVLPQASNESKYSIITNGATRASRALTIANYRQFLSWTAHRQRSIDLWSEAARNYCEKICFLRKSNKEYQHRINGLMNVAKNGTNDDTYYFPRLILLFEQMIQLTNTLDLFTSYFVSIDEHLFFGNQRTIVDGRTINFEFTDPILTTYEKLYRKGRIAALYSEKNDICLCAYLHVGSLSLLTVGEVCDFINSPPFFDKWHCSLQFIDNVTFIPLFIQLNSQMEIVSLEQKDTNHHNNIIATLQEELMKWSESEISHLFVPLDLTEIANKMFSYIFPLRIDPPTFNSFIQSRGTLFHVNDIHQDSVGMTSLRKNESVSTLDSLTSENLVAKATFTHPNFTVQTNSTYSVSKCDTPPIGYVYRKIPKSKQQLLGELTDKTSDVLLSSDSQLLEYLFSNDSLETPDESYALQANDSLFRTPDPSISITTTDNAIWIGKINDFEASQDTKELSYSKVTFLSPLKDDD